MSSSGGPKKEKEEPAAAAAPAGGFDENVVAVDEKLSWHDLDALCEYQINAADIKKLKDTGLLTMNSVCFSTRKELLQIKGMSDVKVDKIIDICRKVCDNGYSTGLQMFEKLKSRCRISTGSEALNTCLGGGIESGLITELYGEYRCGKTQLCHTLSVIAQLPANHGGTNGKVIYVDTENTFRPDRICEIATTFGIEGQQVLENIRVARCFTSDHLEHLLTLAAAACFKEKYGLLIIDSLMAPFRVDFSGRGELAERQQKLGKVLSKSQKLIEEFGLACVITNHVMADPGGAMSFGPVAPKPIGGHILAHFSQIRIQMRKGRGEQRIAKVVDHPAMAETEACLEIGPGGITNAKD